MKSRGFLRYGTLLFWKCQSDNAGDNKSPTHGDVAELRQCRNLERVLRGTGACTKTGLTELLHVLVVKRGVIMPDT